MADLAIVKDGIVINRILGEPGFADGVECAPEVSIGWSYDGETFTPPPEPPAPPPTSADVNAERNRRITAGVTVDVTGAGPIPVAGTDDDTRNLQGLVTAAQLRLGAGDTTTITPFRDDDNVMHDLVPAQVVELWQKAAGYVSAVYEASWAIKAMQPIPADYAADSYWP